MSTLTGKDLNLVKPALTDDHKVTIGTDLPANFQKIDDEFTGHQAESASYGISVTRDISITGVQTVSIPFKAKAIIVFTAVGATKVASWGFWTENDFQRSQAMRGDIGVIGSYAEAIYAYIDNANYAGGRIQNVTDSGYEIAWTKTGSPTGTVAMYTIALTHGEG